jgi:anti-sigma factor RsiW
MNEGPLYTDEELHRYIDGELGDEAAERLENRLARDPALADRGQAYRHVDRALRQALDGLEPPQRTMRPNPRRQGPLGSLQRRCYFSSVSGWAGSVTHP